MENLLRICIVTCADKAVKGELLITKYGLEGGALYQLTRELRRCPEIEIDFKPGSTPADLRKRLPGDASVKEQVVRIMAVECRVRRPDRGSFASENRQRLDLSG